MKELLPLFSLFGRLYRLTRPKSNNMNPRRIPLLAENHLLKFIPVQIEPPLSAELRIRVDIGLKRFAAFNIIRGTWPSVAQDQIGKHYVPYVARYQRMGHVR